MRLHRIISILLLACIALPLSAQVDKREVRAGNRKFKKGNYKEAEIDYRKAVVKDSMSVAGEYNLASTLYREKDYQGAGKALDVLKDVISTSKDADRYWFNKGDVALQQKDWDGAMEAFKQSLLINPGDMDAKENYIYAKKMKKNQDQQNQQNKNQNNQDQNNQQNQQNQQNQDQNKDQQDQNNQNNQDQNQNNQQNQGQQPQPQDQKISQQQAQQMLQAIQAKEKETQDKVNKEKAAVLKSKQKEKNW